MIYYNQLKQSITVNAKIGQKLKDIELPLGYIWDDNIDTVISGKGGEIFIAKLSNNLGYIQVKVNYINI